jgi:hypothetical protein
MKKKILISIFVLVTAMLLSSFAAVMASPAKWTPVIGTTIGKTNVFSGILLNDGGVFFYDVVATGTFTLNTPTAVLTFASNSIINGTINTKTNDGEIHLNVRMTYPAVGEIQGTFEGEVKAKSTTYLYMPTTGYPHPFYSTNIYHTVLQGSGIFDGQTLKLDGIRPTLNPAVYPPVTPSNPISWEGFLLAP